MPASKLVNILKFLDFLAWLAIGGLIVMYSIHVIRGCTGLASRHSVGDGHVLYEHITVTNATIAGIENLKQPDFDSLKSTLRSVIIHIRSTDDITCAWALAKLVGQAEAMDSTRRDILKQGDAMVADALDLFYQVRNFEMAYVFLFDAAARVEADGKMGYLLDSAAAWNKTSQGFNDKLAGLAAEKEKEKMLFADATIKCDGNPIALEEFGVALGYDGEGADAAGPNDSVTPLDL
ncbi:hypothetical protein LTR85_008843 [Meristemomyces frigidus]|nr:hypothetical protein LTR85_008843 [Meristemomyces frigidus]